ncbi:hypothetical protein QBC47DRAFT_145068 [Echria macrotheca]|uniref:Uncharacterized protein n=1 Tax=Echria macrotheca TaxID=438768 RepID=A0AAJ0F907_9PEZI|nr:hypothetical protein QBC47DRAFT_145068 [Echria macrotheca]
MLSSLLNRQLLVAYLVTGKSSQRVRVNDLMGHFGCLLGGLKQKKADDIPFNKPMLLDVSARTSIMTSTNPFNRIGATRSKRLLDALNDDAQPGQKRHAVVYSSNPFRTLPKDAPNCARYPGWPEPYRAPSGPNYQERSSTFSGVNNNYGSGFRGGRGGFNGGPGVASPHNNPFRTLTKDVAKFVVIRPSRRAGRGLKGPAPAPAPAYSGPHNNPFHTTPRVFCHPSRRTRRGLKAQPRCGYDYVDPGGRDEGRRRDDGVFTPD